MTEASAGSTDEFSGAPEYDGPTSGQRLQQALKVVEAAGFMAFKIPACRHADRQHGRHGLITRTAMCPGSEVLPHGYVGYHLGSFGGWIRCQCGSEFRDYGTVDDRHWDQHKAEHGIDTTIGGDRG